MSAIDILGNIKDKILRTSAGFPSKSSQIAFMQASRSLRKIQPMPFKKSMGTSIFTAFIKDSVNFTNPEEYTEDIKTLVKFKDEEIIIDIYPAKGWCYDNFFISSYCPDLEWHNKVKKDLIIYFSKKCGVDVKNIDMDDQFIKDADKINIF